MPGAKYVIYNMSLSMKSLEGGFLKPHEDGDLERGMEPPLQAEERDVIAKQPVFSRREKNQRQGGPAVNQHILMTTAP